MRDGGTPARPRAGLPFALAILVALQVLCALVLTWDLARTVLGLGTTPISWRLRELLEVGAVLGLLLGVLSSVLLLRQATRRADAAETRLADLSSAFSGLVERQFTQWELTEAERDVAWFGLKGLSVAEIASLRGTSDGTVKAQSAAVYRKAGVRSRIEFMSLFLDDLLAGPLPEAPVVDNKVTPLRPTGTQR